ncbi:hypothetical protein [Pseudomonas sp. SDI]|uniref:hypothetical protein n=1 Tax=Pseudomonas sp. SDI TaxID=2170734 RepID=UPI002114253B|nr:hypothetical protein [Pseudomonas sp. SDI]
MLPRLAPASTARHADAFSSTYASEAARADEVWAGAADESHRLGAQRVCLTVARSAVPAVQLYRANGFVAVGATAPLREGSSLYAQAMVLQLKRN